MTGFYKFAMGVMRFIMPLWYRIDAEGLENLPDEGGYLFVSNHRSNADPILIGIQNPETQFCFLAKQELFSDGLVGWLLRKLGAVAVDRGTGDISPLEEIVYRLGIGENALIFPEGTRSKDGKLGRFKTGAALIAGQTGVPVVPVAISFDDELHFRSTIHVRYGKPFEVPQTSADNPSVSVLKEIRQEMTRQVSALLTSDGEPAKLEMKQEKSRQDETKADSGGTSSGQPKKRPPKQSAEESSGEKTETEKNLAALPPETDSDETKPRANIKNTEDTIETMANHNQHKNNGSIDDAAKKKAAERLEEAADEAVSEIEDVIDSAEESAGKAERKRKAVSDDFDDAPVSASPFKIKNPFKKLLKAIDSEDEFAAIEEELTQDEEETPKKPAKKAPVFDDKDEEDLSFTAKKKKPVSEEKDDSEKEPEKPEKKADAEEDVPRLPVKKKQTEEDDVPKLPVGKKSEEDEEPRLPVKKKKTFEDEEAPRLPVKPKKAKFEDEPDFADDADSSDSFYDDELYDDDEQSKGGLFGGFSLKNKFRKKDDDEYDDEYDDDEYDDDEYDDDDEYEDGVHRFDYGKIALILTFVILGIFAFDFCRRLYNDWKDSQGMLDIQSQASSNVESMDGDNGEATATMTMITSTQKPVSGTTIATTTTTTNPDETTTSSTSQIIDNRETETISLDNNLLHSGSLVLINNDHQQVSNPTPVTFADIPYQHLRVVRTDMQVDKSLSDPIVNMFNDFFTNTGLGNIMVYSTTLQSGNPPYNISIPERTTGLCLDLSILNEAASSHSPYTADGSYAWLSEHAADYGFILRYPADKADKTGMNGISWHFRYVGAPHATYMKENNLCLEEYLELIANHPWDSEHLKATVNGVEYEMYYVPASDTEASTVIKYPASANGATPMISGDNIDGFVVAVPKT